MTNILSIETSSESCSVAISVDGDVLERFEQAPMRHAELVLPMVEQVLAEAALSLPRVDVIAFGRGPGSFTGLRIGIGVVQGLAWAAEKPVVPVSSLAAVAQSFFDLHQPADILRVCVAMDARMQEVFTARFLLAPTGVVVLDSAERVGPAGSIGLDPAGAIGAAGNGFERYPELVEQGSKLEWCIPDCWPRAASIGRIASEWLEKNEPLPAEQAQPVYIRDNIAQKPT